MPQRQDIKSILILGAGPIIIGQACEFDYSGTQACRVLRQLGYRIILVNSNPATIMTDPDFADSTYIEPVNWQMVERIIAIERPDALLPTMGGQTALNCALDLAKHGVLEKYKVELIGARREAIDKAEDREKFRLAMQRIGLEVPKAAIAHSLEEANQVQAQLGFPTVIRPSFTLGGSGGGIAYNREEFEEICERGLKLSPTHELLIEESVLGWKEFELEVVRDRQDNCIIICAIENIDPMGVHTGDSITVAPAQTLTDKEYQVMRNAAIKVLREIGVDTGGSNVQFALDPKTGRMLVIEMNPRVSRSSALASKATGFPIAKIAALLAVGFTLDELQNEMTDNKTPASFEPTLDYVVTKIPRFNFDKFPQADGRLTTQMQSVGEVMAIGRTFQESMQKALRSLETGRTGFDPIITEFTDENIHLLKAKLRIATEDRILLVADGFRAGLTVTDVSELTHIDPWFIAQIAELVSAETEFVNKIKSAQTLSSLTYDDWFYLKRKGFSDLRLAKLALCHEDDIRRARLAHKVKPVYKRVDSVAAEFPTETATLYTTYEQYCEAKPSDNKKVIILGGGPNRIGQGIEFDYCCVHAVLALKQAGYETIMVNCNPETVSTDFDIAHRLYFEPVTLEDVLAIVDIEKPEGVIVHYGGQTPLKLANALVERGITILGTSSDSIDVAEDRKRFQQLLKQLKLKQPANDTAIQLEEAISIANRIGYPVLVRPSYVLGGRAMEIVYSDNELTDYLIRAKAVTQNAPILIDKYLDDAIEVDVDAVCDGENVFIGAIMEHIEQAGVHSGDSSCTLPPFSLGTVMIEALKKQMRQLAKALNVVGLVNAQFAIQGDDIYVLEVNPRASRTVPFVSKALGLPLAKIAALCKVGINLKTQGLLNQERVPDFYAIKMPVFPFAKFRGTDTILGPEMKSTGEVMGLASRFGQAYARALMGANISTHQRETAFLSVRQADKSKVAEVAKRLHDLGFNLVATRGTERVIAAAGIPCTPVNKVMEGRPHIVDMIKNNEIDFIVNTTEGRQSIADSLTIRQSAIQQGVSYTTTIAGGLAAALAMKYEEHEVITKLQSLWLSGEAVPSEQSEFSESK